MNEYFKAVKISDSVYWVGAIDWNVRNFHGYRTERGTTYNAFLVIDRKVTLIDTVKAQFAGELLARIRSIIDPRKIDYVVSNHSEMDHAGALPDVISAVKPEKIFASPMGQRNLREHFGADLAVETVKTGDTLPLGKRTLHFVESKMLHWPDSMVSYLDGDGILFSQDAFGMHLAGSSLYADEYPDCVLESESKKYFANILLHLSPKILALLDALPSYKLDIGMIAPDHGPLWRRDTDRIVRMYREYAEQKWKNRALVFYATMWKSTEKLARAIADGIAGTGVQTEVMSLDAFDRSAVITAVFESGIVAAGTPTMNNQMYPSVADILTYSRGLRPVNHIGAAFGSYGWSGEGAKLVQEELTAQGFEMPFAPLGVKFVPTEEDLSSAYDLGVSLSRKLREKL